MSQEEDNKKAADGVSDEMKKLGLKPNEDEKDEDLDEEDDSDIDEDEDESDSDDDDADEEDEDESDDSDSDDDDDSDEDDSDEDDEDDNDSPQGKNKRGTITFKAHNKLRKELRDTQKKLDELIGSKEVDKKKDLPEDFQKRVEALAKELQIEDPEGLTKIVNLIKDVSDKDKSELEERLKRLESDNAKKTIVDEFPSEWKSFAKDVFIKEFPNATKEQVKDAQKVMEKLAKSRKTGGKVYKDSKSGQELLDPFPLEYIFWKHKDEFGSIVTGKKVRGMETSKTQKNTSGGKGGETKNLNKHSTAKDIRSLDKEYSAMEAGVNSMRSPEDSSI